MVIYINGCSHTAAAEAVVPHAFAEDDKRYDRYGRAPHPVNFRASWATHVSNSLGFPMTCDAESAASNDRILRTTRAWMQKNKDQLHKAFVIIQWSTWEREEWLHQNIWYQVNASGTDIVPPELIERYKKYVIEVDWKTKTLEAHEKIWQLHCDLEQQSIGHLFFNGHSTFSELSHDQRHNWGTSYLEPYSVDHSYNAILRQNGYEYVNPRSYHFGANAHCFWAQYVLKYIQDHKLLESHALSTD